MVAGAEQHRLALQGDPGLALGQHLLELLTIPASGEHFTRRPSRHLAATGAEIVDAWRAGG